MRGLSIEQVLERQGPMLSNELADILIASNEGLTPAAARKRVQRRNPGVHRLAQIVFPHRARFIYLEKDYGSPRFIESLLSALKKTNNSYYFALTSLIHHGGALPIQYFLSACGAPAAQKGHVSAARIIEGLEKATLIKRILVPSLGECVVLFSREQYLSWTNYSDLRARLIAERITLLAVKDWARNLGLVSYEAIKVRGDSDEIPKVGTLYWDLTGPSYVYPLTRRTSEKVKPGFLVCDIALLPKLNDEAVSTFIKKCVLLRRLPNIASCIQIFLAEDFKKEALIALKNQGIIPATPQSLFGKEVAQALLNLINVFKDTAQVVDKPEVLDNLFESLGKIEGASGALRGCLFEFMVAHIAQTTFPGCEVEMNRQIKAPTGAMAEIDVLAQVKRQTIHFIECKGHHPMGFVDELEVEKWLFGRIATIREYAKNHSEWRNLKHNFELWTSGKLSEETRQKLNSVQTSTNRFTVEIRDGDYVLAQAKNSLERAFIKTYKQHFVDHPMREHIKAEKKLAKRKGGVS